MIFYSIDKEKELGLGATTTTITAVISSNDENINNSFWRNSLKTYLDPDVRWSSKKKGWVLKNCNIQELKDYVENYNSNVVENSDDDNDDDDNNNNSQDDDNNDGLGSSQDDDDNLQCYSSNSNSNNSSCSQSKLQADDNDNNSLEKDGNSSSNSSNSSLKDDDDDVNSEKSLVQNQCLMIISSEAAITKIPKEFLDHYSTLARNPPFQVIEREKRWIKEDKRK